MSKDWIGVDFDRTLAHHMPGQVHLGTPILSMVYRVKRWLSEGKQVRIFTARVWHDGSPERKRHAETSRKLIEEWCKTHLGRILPVTNEKDYDMERLYDDRAVQVQPNTGVLVGEE